MQHIGARIQQLCIVIFLLMSTGCDASTNDNLFLPRIVATGSPEEFSILKDENRFKEISSYLYGREQNLAHAAIENKKFPNVLELLFQAGVNLDHRDADGRTPLHHAIDADRIEAARILINLGASLTVKNEAGYSPALFCKEALKSLPSHKTCQLVLQASENRK